MYVTFSREFPDAKITTIIELSKLLSDYLLIYTDNEQLPIYRVRGQVP